MGEKSPQAELKRIIYQKMKLLNSPGPNPRVVRMFLLEKGIELPFEEIDILNASNREPAYLELNPAGQLPALILDDGVCISETVATVSEVQTPSSKIRAGN